MAYSVDLHLDPEYIINYFNQPDAEEYPEVYRDPNLPDEDPFRYSELDIRELLIDGDLDTDYIFIDTRTGLNVTVGQIMNPQDESEVVIVDTPTDGEEGDNELQTPELNSPFAAVIGGSYFGLPSDVPA